MSLAKYKEKRSFEKKTPEPTGGKPKDNKLHLVVQKHLLLISIMITV